MQNFQDTLETRKRLFISAFSICITVSLINGKVKYKNPYLFWGRLQHVLGTGFCGVDSTHLDLI